MNILYEGPKRTFTYFLNECSYDFHNFWLSFVKETQNKVFAYLF